MASPLFSEYAPERCTEHGPLCEGAAGGDHIEEPVTFAGGPFISKRLDATRCVVCGHRLDDMGGCDSCAADREAAEWEGYDRAG